MKYKSSLALLGFMFFSISLSIAQENLFRDFLPRDYNLQSESKRLYDLYLDKANVSDIYLVKLNTEVFSQASININLPDQSSIASMTRFRSRTKTNQSWFGKMEDEFGIFFTIIDNHVSSKFYLGNYAYTMMPLEDDIHAVIEYSSTDVGICANNSADKDHDHDDDERPKPKKKNTNNLLHANDNDCNLRVILAFTADAEGEIMGTLDQFAQMAIDEANLAYMDSDINFEMELARAIRTTYNEVNTLTGGRSTDLARLQNATAPLNQVHDMRELYNSDIQILIREGNMCLPLATCTGACAPDCQIFGEAFDIPTDTDDPDENEGFAVVTVDGVTDGRFSFTHEIGHLQGARHENHVDNPNFARGFLSPGTGANRWRTLMTRQGAANCTQLDACRVQLFSNPDVNGPGGVAAGAADRDNARRLDDTRNDILAFRQTDENLTLDNETVDNELVSNHLANHTITTGGNDVVYNSGSLGTMRAGEQVLLQHRTVIRNGSRFRAFIDLNPCETLPPLPFTNPPEKESIIQQLNEGDIFKLSVIPNPAKDRITINYHLDSGLQTALYLLDARGQLVQVLENAVLKDSGAHNIDVNISALTPGLYFCQLQAGQQKATYKFIVQ